MGVEDFASCYLSLDDKGLPVGYDSACEAVC